jgi:DNA-binding cell septation regulator SpoVG
MQVTSVDIYLIAPKGGLCGFANITIDNALVLRGIGLYERMDSKGYRITYPIKNRGYCFHPINNKLGKVIETAIFAELKVVMSKQNAGYGGIDCRQS